MPKLSWTRGITRHINQHTQHKISFSFVEDKHLGYLLCEAYVYLKRNHALYRSSTCCIEWIHALLKSNHMLIWSDVCLQ